MTTNAGANKKPTLAGASIKQRKGAQKLAAKFEPAPFRDNLVKHLEACPPGDFEAYARKLDELGNELDFRKYENELFQILLIGSLIAPGGAPVQDGANTSPFSLLTSVPTLENGQVDVPKVKAVIEVFHKLLRRYKYLLKDFEETSLPGILQNCHKYDATPEIAASGNADTPVNRSLGLPEDAASPASSAVPSRVGTPSQQPAASLPPLTLPPRPNQDKLAVATALCVLTGLCGPAIIQSVKKEQLVKTGSAAAFLVVYCRTILAQENAEYLGNALRRGGAGDLATYFPKGRNNLPDVTAFFKSIKLDVVADFYAKQRAAEVTRYTSSRLRDLVEKSESNEEILAFLAKQYKTKAVSEGDFMGIIWTGVAGSVDLSSGDAAAATQALLDQLKEFSGIFEQFAQSAKSEVALINAIQVWCYENTLLMPSFVKILMTLFNADVLSSAAIAYWHGKGSKPQGRQQFLKSSEPLVKKLAEMDDEDSDDE